MMIIGALIPARHDLVVARLSRLWLLLMGRAQSARSARRANRLRTRGSAAEVATTREDLTVTAQQRFERLYDQNWDDVRAYCRRRCASETDADDVLAETFAIAWRRLDDVPANGRSRPWLFGVARNLLREHYRRGDWTKTITGRLTTELATAAGPDIPGEDLASLELGVTLQALAGLEEPDREVIQLVAWERLPHNQAAEALGCSTNAVAIRLHRARQRLQVRVDELSRQEFS